MMIANRHGPMLARRMGIVTLTLDGGVPDALLFGAEDDADGMSAGIVSPGDRRSRGSRGEGRMKKLLRILSVAALVLAPMLAGIAEAQDTVRHGIQRGALASLRVAMADVEAKHNLKYVYEEFDDSTALGLKAGDWRGLAELAKKRNSEGRPLKIGVPTGSMQYLKLTVALKGAGVNPDKDVSVVNVPFPNHPRAIEGGEVDIAMTLAVSGTLSIDSGKGTLFDHVSGTDAGKQKTGFIVRRDYVQRVVASHHEAMKSVVDDVPNVDGGEIPGQCGGAKAGQRRADWSRCEGARSSNPPRGEFVAKS